MRLGSSSVRAVARKLLQPNQHYSRELLMMGIVVPETC